MHRTRKERFDLLKASIAASIRGYFQGEHSLHESTHEVRKAIRKFLKKTLGGPDTKEHKEANRYTKRGAALYNEGEYRDAEEQFRCAVEMDPHYARAHYYLGNTFYKRGRLTEAVTAWKHAIDAEPNSDVADSAREKLLVVGHGEDGLISTIKEQMLHRK